MTIDSWTELWPVVAIFGAICSGMIWITKSVVERATQPLTVALAEIRKERDADRKDIETCVKRLNSHAADSRKMRDRCMAFHGTNGAVGPLVEEE